MQRILLLGHTALTPEIAVALEGDPRHYAVAGVVAWPTDTSDAAVTRWLADAIEQTRPTRIVVGMTERRLRLSSNALLDACTRYRVSVEEDVTFYERLTGRVAIHLLPPSTILFSWPLVDTSTSTEADRFVGRLLAFVALVVLTPLLALIALAIKCSSTGPVLFVQERLGAGGRPFRLLKFRTMHLASTRVSEWEADNKYRVTRIGRWLRRLRLDELPQLVNVLRGEMTLVGPRPHPVTNRELFTLVGRNLNDRTGHAVAYYALRSTVTPGVTGWAQVRYRYANNLEEEMEKLQYDLYYVKYRSRRLDLRILRDTLRVMLLGVPRAPVPAAPRPADAPPVFNASHNTTLTT